MTVTMLGVSTQRRPHEAVIATMRTGRRCLYITNYGRCVSDGRAGSTLQVRAAVTSPLTAAAVKRINEVCHRLSDLTSGDHNATTRDRIHDAHDYTVSALVRALACQPIAYHRTLHIALYLPHSTHRSVMVPFVMPPPRAEGVNAPPPRAECVSAPPTIIRINAPAPVYITAPKPAVDLIDEVPINAPIDTRADDTCADDDAPNTCAEDAFTCDEGFGSFSLETGWSF